MNSGYKIISLNNIDFETGTTHKINGIYDRIENGHNKPLLLKDIVYNHIERVARYISYVVNEGNYLIILSDINASIIITHDDDVTIIENETVKPKVKKVKKEN